MIHADRHAFLNVPSFTSWSLRVSSNVTGRPSSSHRFKSRAASLGDVRLAGSMPQQPNAMISFLMRTSIFVNG